jgi:hypothetical protein
MKRLTAISLCGAFAAVAFAQHDPTSVWPQWKGNNSKSASVAAPGPATDLEWILELPADPNDPNSDPVIPSPGGITLDGEGNLYWVAMDDSGTMVYKASPAGTIVAQSINFGAGVGSYGGIAIGATEVFFCNSPAVSDTRIHVLDKTTLTLNRTLEPPEFAANGARFRGTPLIGQVPGNDGNVNLYLHDRDGNLMYAVDSVTGAVEWSYALLTGSCCFDQVGPTWVRNDGRQAVAYFANDTVGAGVVIADNGDGTFDVLWELGAPFSFNWWGSGVLSQDGDNIYVTTFNDNNQPPLWSVATADGSELASVPGFRGQGPKMELNFFGRPTVVDNRIYCGGGFGVVAAFEDQDPNLVLIWKYQDLDPNDPNLVVDQDEFTGIASAENPCTGDAYIYALSQGNAFLDPNNPDPNNPVVPGSDGNPTFVVLRDDGASFTTLLNSNDVGLDFRRGLEQLPTEAATLFGAGPVVAADGSVYFAVGNAFSPGVQPSAIFKFSPACTGDADGDGDVDLDDLTLLLQNFGTGPCGDIDGNGGVDLDDLTLLLQNFGCTT